MSVQRSVSLTTRGRASTSPAKRNSAMLFNSNTAAATSMYESTPGRLGRVEEVSEVQHLRAQVEALRKEWQTSEELLTESQRDNEQKHFMIESYKQYVKELEKLLESTLGSTWRFDNKISGPSFSPPTQPVSTPLSKPLSQSLRHSTSVTFSSKRSSRLMCRRMSGAGDWSTLAGVQEVPQDEELDNTPTGALKRLEGQSTLAVKPAIPIIEVEAPPITPVAQLTRSYKRIEPIMEPVKDPAPNVDPACPAQDTKLESLITMLSAIPLDQILPALDVTKSTAREEAARKGLESQKRTIEVILRDAEKRAEEREVRLRIMLAEVKNMAVS